MSVVYRQCASAFVERVTPQGTEVLLVHKPRKCDAWQLPQGGMEDGETCIDAAKRELEEETCLCDIDVLAESTQTYQYDFPESFRKERPDNVCGQCVHFVFMRKTSDEPVKVDNTEIDAHVWVHPEHFHEFVIRPEYKEMLKRLVEERRQLE